ncbi:hypothetical protein V502_08992 [Pseudogymnoascus sp. VKM F-4520 (FW-2644)]|nr:hypothetical protein V502_08992 [Pseudogymnoascus sp. VKM F-4520 (FW-2644)]
MDDGPAMGACFWASELVLAGVCRALLSDAADGWMRACFTSPTPPHSRPQIHQEPYPAPTAIAKSLSTTTPHPPPTYKMPPTHTARTSPFPQPSTTTSLAHPTPRRALSLLTDVAQRLDTHTPTADYKTRDVAGGEWHAPPPPPPSPVSW